MGRRYHAWSFHFLKAIEKDIRTLIFYRLFRKSQKVFFYLIRLYVQYISSGCAYFYWENSCDITDHVLCSIKRFKTFRFPSKNKKISRKIISFLDIDLSQQTIKICQTFYYWPQMILFLEIANIGKGKNNKSGR